jgi:hypothetical protein
MSESDNNAQLLVGPNSSSSLIRKNSSFLSKKITLSGDDNGVGLLLTNTSNTSIKSLGGAELDGKIVCQSIEDVTTCNDNGTTTTHASVELYGGLHVAKTLNVSKNLCVEGTILNRDMATKNNLVSSAEYITLDALYAKKLYCINILGYSSNPPEDVTQTTLSGNGILDIVIVKNVYCPNLNVLEDESVDIGVCGDLDIDTVLHYYLGPNYTGEYILIDNLYVDMIYCPHIHTVRGRPFSTGFGGFGNASAGTNLGTSAYIGGIQSFDSWKFDLDFETKRLKLQQFNAELDAYIDPLSQHRIWISYRNFDFLNGNWSIIREEGNNNAISYFLQKSPSNEISYIVSDITMNVKGELTKGFFLKKIYISYEISDQEIEAIDVNVSKKIFDRENPNGSSSSTYISSSSGNLSEGTQIGSHYRYISFSQTNYANYHQIFTLELACNTKTNSVFKFHGCFIEYDKDEQII